MGCRAVHTQHLDRQFISLPAGKPANPCAPKAYAYALKSSQIFKPAPEVIRLVEGIDGQRLQPLGSTVKERGGFGGSVKSTRTPRRKMERLIVYIRCAVRLCTRAAQNQPPTSGVPGQARLPSTPARPAPSLARERFWIADLRPCVRQARHGNNLGARLSSAISMAQTHYHCIWQGVDCGETSRNEQHRKKAVLTP